MKAELLNEGGDATYVLVLETGEEVVARLKLLALIDLASSPGSR